MDTVGARSRVSALFLLATLFLLAILMPVTGCGCLTEWLGPILGSPTVAESNFELMATAEAMVAGDYPEAVLIEAIGLPSSGSASTAEDIDRWQFRFAEDPQASGAGTVWVDYENGSFSGPFYTSQGLLGTVFEVLPRKLTLADAIASMRAAGFTEAFSDVTVRKPLTFPIPEEHLYVFVVQGRFVLVGALTGNVSEEAADAEEEPSLLMP